MAAELQQLDLDDAQSTVPEDAEEAGDWELASKSRSAARHRRQKQIKREQRVSSC